MVLVRKDVEQKLRVRINFEVFQLSRQRFVFVVLLQVVSTARYLEESYNFGEERQCQRALILAIAHGINLPVNHHVVVQDQFCI